MADRQRAKVERSLASGAAASKDRTRKEDRNDQRRSCGNRRGQIAPARGAGWETEVLDEGTGNGVAGPRRGRAGTPSVWSGVADQASATRGPRGMTWIGTSDGRYGARVRRNDRARGTSLDGSAGRSGQRRHRNPGSVTGTKKHRRSPVGDERCLPVVPPHFTAPGRATVSPARCNQSRTMRRPGNGGRLARRSHPPSPTQPRGSRPFGTELRGLFRWRFRSRFAATAVL
jgi:hypothetical protein